MTTLDKDWHQNTGDVPAELLADDRVLIRFKDGLESAPRIVGGLRWTFDALGDDIDWWRFFCHADGLD